MNALLLYLQRWQVLLWKDKTDTANKKGDDFSSPFLFLTYCLPFYLVGVFYVVEN